MIGRIDVPGDRAGGTGSGSGSGTGTARERGRGLRTRTPDLRLAGTAAGCWLAALAGLYLPLVPEAAVAAVAACGAVSAAWVASRPGRAGLPARQARWLRSRAGRLTGRVGWVAAAVMVGIALGAGVTAVQVAIRDAEPLATLVRERALVRVALVVTDDPRPVARSRGQTTLAASARLVWLERAGEAVTSRATRIGLGSRVLVLASDPGWGGLLPGQRATAIGRLARTRGGDLRAAVLSVGTAPEAVEAAPWVQRAAGGLRAGLRRACRPLPPEPGGLLPGLVVGDTSGLDPALADDFRATGMTHLVAVSGSNCAIVVGAVLLLARWCRAGPRLSAVLCTAALIGFVILARPSPSVLRAAAMGALALVALASGRQRMAVPALATAITVLVVVDPELAGDAGFALSVLATGGLLFLAGGWSAALRARRVPRGLAEAVAVPAAAQVACAPVIAALSGTVSLTAVPANLLAVPAVAPATVLGVAAALLSPVPGPAASFVAWLAGWPARWLVGLAHAGARTPAGLLPWPGGPVGGLLLATLLLGILGIGRVPPLRRLALALVLAAAVGAVPVRLVAAGWPPRGWFVVACDVGEGDALVLAAGPGSVVVVDAGPEPGAVDRCLRGLRVSRIELLVVSHFHLDHIGGLAGALRGRSLGAAVVPEYSEPAAGRASVEAQTRRAGVPARVARAGWAYQVGAVRLDALVPGRLLHGTRSDPNNNSLVLRATIAGHTVLLAGDAEGEEQAEILAGEPPGRLRAEVLKTSHHGSSYQDEDFLAAVAPLVALVSAGRDNDYGHPYQPLLVRLARDGARVLRTDLVGDVAVISDPRGIAVVVHGPATTGHSL